MNSRLMLLLDWPCHVCFRYGLREFSTEPFQYALYKAIAFALALLKLSAAVLPSFSRYYIKLVNSVRLGLRPLLDQTNF